MAEVTEKITRHAMRRYFRQRGDHADPAIYFDNRVLRKGAKLDLLDGPIAMTESTRYVFIDEQPGMNWGHACQYLLYNSTTGKFREQVDAKFPPFLNEDRFPSAMEALRTPVVGQRHQRARPLRMALDPATLSSYSVLARLPLRFLREGRRFAILYSGGSNCRHVNDFEFLYRVLLDVYGFNPGDIYVCNYDGNVNWSQACWGGFCEPVQNLASPIDYPVDGTPFRLQVDEPGTRAGFQNVISDLAPRIGSKDCLFIFTNNHGWYGTRPGGTPDEGFLSTYGGGQYWAEDFASDLQELPPIKTLLAVMEQCSSGSFIQPVLNASTADRTVVQTAVPAKESSAGSWFFDPWIELWISAVAGVRGDGSAMSVSPDDDLDGRINAKEAYDFASSQDNPRMGESSTDVSESVFLSACGSAALLKRWREDYEYKEWRKEIKELYKERAKDHFEFKAVAREDYEFPFRIEEFRPRPERMGAQHRVTGEVRTLTGRVQALEHALNRLSPFIRSEQRPEMRAAAFEKRGRKKR